MKAIIIKKLDFGHSTWESTTELFGDRDEIIEEYRAEASLHAGNGLVRFFTKHQPGHTVDYSFDGLNFHEEWLLLF